MGTSRQTNRRQFLEGESAVAALADSAKPPSARPLTSRRRSNRLAGRASPLADGRTAMACEFEALLNAGPSAGIARGRGTARSGGDDRGPVERIPRPERDQPAEPPRRTSPSRSSRGCSRSWHARWKVSIATGGAYDITAGPLSKVWGFFRLAARLPGDEDRSRRFAVGCLRHLKLDAAQRTVRFARPGMEINLGSIGKVMARTAPRNCFATRRSTAILSTPGTAACSVRACAGGVIRSEGWRVTSTTCSGPRGDWPNPAAKQGPLHGSPRRRQFFFHQGRWYGHRLGPADGPARGRDAVGDRRGGERRGRRRVVHCARSRSGRSALDTARGRHPEIGQRLSAPPRKTAGRRCFRAAWQKTSCGSSRGRFQLRLLSHAGLPLDLEWIGEESATDDANQPWTGQPC